MNVNNLYFVMIAALINFIFFSEGFANITSVSESEKIYLKDIIENCRNKLEINQQFQYTLFHDPENKGPFDHEYAYKIGHLNGKIYAYYDILNQLEKLEIQELNFNNIQVKK